MGFSWKLRATNTYTTSATARMPALSQKYLRAHTPTHGMTHGSVSDEPGAGRRLMLRADMPCAQSCLATAMAGAHQDSTHQS
jgi:hypothetical protein